MADLRLRQRIGNTAFSALPAGFFIVQAPVPLLAPYLVAFNPELAAQFGLEPTLELVDRLLRALQAGRVDYPAFMRSLGVFRPEDNAHDARQARRDAVNPLYVCCALMWPNGPSTWRSTRGITTKWSACAVCWRNRSPRGGVPEDCAAPPPDDGGAIALSCSS